MNPRFGFIARFLKEPFVNPLRVHILVRGVATGGRGEGGKRWNGHEQGGGGGVGGRRGGAMGRQGRDGLGGGLGQGVEGRGKRERGMGKGKGSGSRGGATHSACVQYYGAFVCIRSLWRLCCMFE